MRRISIAALTAIFTIPLAHIASAADMPTKAPPPPPAPAVYNWTGFYIGVHAGYGWQHVSGIYDQLDAAGPTDLGRLKLNGFVGGGQLGYNWQFSQFVLGVEVDGSWASDEDTIFSPEPPARGPDPITAKRSYLASARGRIGYAFDRVLVYGTGGVGWTRNKVTITDRFSETTGSISSSKAGWVAGGGVEYAFAAKWTVRGEYLHYAVGRTRALDPAVFSDADPGDYIKFRGVDVARVGVNYRF